KPVVVDFWATWCGPCKMVAPEMEKLAEKYAGAVDVVKVDVDANPRLSQTFNIMSIPTIAFFPPGQQPMGVIGFRPLEQGVRQPGAEAHPCGRGRRAREVDAARGPFDFPADVPSFDSVTCRGFGVERLGNRHRAAASTASRSARWSS